MKFYGLALTKENKSVRVPVEATIRHQAEDEAWASCKENEWAYQGVFAVNNSQKQPSPVGKRFANGEPTPRKKGRGKR